MSETNSDFVDDIVPAAEPHHLTVQAEFAPWHKVRKQYIRKHQWNKQLLVCAQRQCLSDIRCLVIPGDDLLDVRSLWHDSQALNCTIRYLGFNERHNSTQEGTRLHIAHNALMSKGRIDGASLVTADRFQSIANKNSKAYSYMREHGPFNVVNLDICDTLFPSHTASNVQAYYDALHCLAAYQMKEQTAPWLLFLTTQVEPATVDKVALERLLVPTAANMTTNRDFLDKLFALLSQTGQSIPTGQTLPLDNLSPAQMRTTFGIGLGKWLLQLATSSHPEWTVSMYRSYRYSIEPSTNTEMLSLAFAFRRRVVPPVDTSGLSTHQPAATSFPTEAESAMTILKEVERLGDVDALLYADSNLHTSLRDESASLLESVGYDRATYLQWIAQGEPTTN